MDGRLSTWKLQQETKSPGESVNEQRAEGRMCEPFTCKAGMQEREIRKLTPMEETGGRTTRGALVWEREFEEQREAQDCHMWQEVKFAKS